MADENPKKRKRPLPDSSEELDWLMKLDWDFVGEGDTEVRDAIRQLAIVLMPVAKDLREASAKREMTDKAKKDRKDELKKGEVVFSSIGSLIDHLRSGDLMQRADRDLLAEILSGDLGREVGHPTIKAAEKQKRHEADQQVLTTYDAKMKVRPRPTKEDVIASCAEQYGLTPEKMQSIVKKRPPKLPRQSR